jgi:hypothetical protein
MTVHDKPSVPGAQGHTHEGKRHGGHSWMMMACCVPMLVIAIILVATGIVGVGFVVIAIMCTVMMAMMMGAMDSGDQRG